MYTDNSSFVVLSDIEKVFGMPEVCEFVFNIFVMVGFCVVVWTVASIVMYLLGWILRMIGWE